MWTLNIRNVWICKESEYLELRKFNGKLCTLNVRTVWTCREIEYSELSKFNGKLCTLFVQNVWFSREIEYPKFRKFRGKLCTLYMYEMSRFAKKLNILNYGNSTVNYVNYRYRMSGFADKLVSRTAKIQWEIVYNICTECLVLRRNWMS